MAEDGKVRAVRFDEYGGVDVLHVDEVELRPMKADEVVVRVKAAGVNPGETNIRSGALRDRWPATFPSGQGSDFAGVIESVGADVQGWAVGDEVLGWSWERSSQAEKVVVPASQIVRKPDGLSWEAAGALYVAGCSAYAAVQAVAPRPGETVAVSAAAGGVGSIVVQLLRLKGAHVIAIASDRHADWLQSHSATVVNYGDGLADRIRAAAPHGVDAFIDLFGPEYVRLAVELGVPRDRIETLTSFDAAREFGAKTAGSADGTSTEVLAEMAQLAADGQIEIPIAAAYPLDQVREAFSRVEERHTLGKVVLIP
jgi:NADPH:quinone reductase-like Zn-dependent oxidoreductase